MTNNLDDSDADETLVVAEYFGRPVAGGEAKDDGRTGYVRLFSLGESDQTEGHHARADRQRASPRAASRRTRR